MKGQIGTSMQIFSIKPKRKKKEMSELEKLKRGIGCAIGSNLKYTPHENNRNNNAST